MTSYQPADINDPGDPGTLQRIVYDAARATSVADWQRLSTAIDTYMDKLHHDKALATELGLLINAYGVAIEKILELYLVNAKVRDLLEQV